MPRLWLAAAVVLSAVLVMRPARSVDPLDAFAVAEQARVRAHFDSAEREVRAHPVAGLSVEQRAARARALDRLHAYAARGVFPRNRHFPGALVPSFVDDRTGTRCGMAYLIEQSGSSGLVARIAATNNNASIPDLKNDPELLAWLERNGLSLEEAARIQPSYCGLPPEQQLIPCPDAVESEASTGYKTATALSVVADVLAVALNSTATRLSPTMTGAAGIVSGAVGVAIGVPNLDESGSLKTLGWVNVGAGVASAAFGTYRLAHKPSTGARLTIGPWLRGNWDPGFTARVVF
ncbi:MAG TPA: hypothetical protein VLV16_05880 [Gemmatimonadales bacterium]|nr:hypothetical protein [Gemmatimonadales bacterium]